MGNVQNSKDDSEPIKSFSRANTKTRKGTTKAKDGIGLFIQSVDLQVETLENRASIHPKLKNMSVLGNFKVLDLILDSNKILDDVFVAQLIKKKSKLINHVTMVYHAQHHRDFQTLRMLRNIKVTRKFGLFPNKPKMQVPKHFALKARKNCCYFAKQLKQLTLEGHIQHFPIWPNLEIYEGRLRNVQQLMHVRKMVVKIHKQSDKDLIDSFRCLKFSVRLNDLSILFRKLKDLVKVQHQFDDAMKYLNLSHFKFTLSLRDKNIDYGHYWNLDPKLRVWRRITHFESSNSNKSIELIPFCYHLTSLTYNASQENETLRAKDCQKLQKNLADLQLLKIMLNSGSAKVFCNNVNLPRQLKELYIIIDQFDSFDMLKDIGSSRTSPLFVQLSYLKKLRIFEMGMESWEFDPGANKLYQNFELISAFYEDLIFSLDPELKKLSLLLNVWVSKGNHMLSNTSVLQLLAEKFSKLEDLSIHMTFMYLSDEDVSPEINKLTNLKHVKFSEGVSFYRMLSQCKAIETFYFAPDANEETDIIIKFTKLAISQINLESLSIVLNFDELVSLNIFISNLIEIFKACKHLCEFEAVLMMKHPPPELEEWMIKLLKWKKSLKNAKVSMRTAEITKNFFGEITKASKNDFFSTFKV